MAFGLIFKERKNTGLLYIKSASEKTQDFCTVKNCEHRFSVNKY